MFTQLHIIIKYLKMSTIHREGRWRGRRSRARHGGAKRSAGVPREWGLGRGAITLPSMGVWEHCRQKILKFNSANLFIFSTISRQRQLFHPLFFIHLLHLFIIDHPVVFTKVNTVKQNNVYHCVLFYRKDTFTMGPQGYCANSLSSPSEISIAFCYCYSATSHNTLQQSQLHT